MHAKMKAVVVAASLLSAAPAMAQYVAEAPPPPPPPGAPQSEYGGGVKIKNNVLRASGGIAWASAGYYCGYYYYYYSCTNGYSVVWPNVNLDFDFGIKGPSAITLGVNYMWGSYNNVDGKIWEPHIDYLLRGNALSEVRGRFRIGFGMYFTSTTYTGTGGGTGTGTGGAFRIGGGASLLNNSPVGIGLDAIFEAGSIKGYYVSTFQLLIGPEFHL